MQLCLKPDLSSISQLSEQIISFFPVRLFEIGIGTLQQRILMDTVCSFQMCFFLGSPYDIGYF
jgi:hypothetical protein